MRMIERAALLAPSLLLALPIAAAVPRGAAAATFYVRQTVGDDASDGLSAKTAWQHISKLSSGMHAGDTAYVGPGLYRDEVVVENGGTAEKRVTFIADTSGQYTGDPPGPVMITGAEPVDAAIFDRYSAPGVYKAQFSAYPVLGVTEMDGDQSRYVRVTITEEYHVQKMDPVSIVVKLPSSFHYDEDAQLLYIHTSDGKPPADHEVELMKRGAGFLMMGKPYVTVMGFTLRHMGDSGIDFYDGSNNGIAANNISYGGRQGIRSYDSKDIVVYGNTLFRNENCGIYFGYQSMNGLAIGNVAYENVCGFRWGYNSVNGLVLDNTAFDNQERGISIEEADHVILRRNKMMHNKQTQLMIFQSDYGSEDNCLEGDSPEQTLVNFFGTGKTYKSLPEYQKAKNQDLHSRQGGCGPLPTKPDVHQLQRDATTYAERARRILSQSLREGSAGANGGEAQASGFVRGWVKRLLGW